MNRQCNYETIKKIKSNKITEKRLGIKTDYLHACTGNERSVQVHELNVWIVSLKNGKRGFAVLFY